MPAANQIFSLFVVKTTVFSSHLYYNNTEPRNPDCHKAFHITVTVFLSHINSKNKGELTMIRRIIHINEEKCNGCGACADACHESAIGMVNGKAKLLRKKRLLPLILHSLYHNLTKRKKHTQLTVVQASVSHSLTARTQQILPLIMKLLLHLLQSPLSLASGQCRLN